MVNALAHVQDAMGGSIDAAQGQFEQLQRRFVGLGLLCGDDFVEFNFQLGAGEGEEIVVDVGENREAKARLELAESGDGVRPGPPRGRESGSERTSLAVGVNRSSAPNWRTTDSRTSR